MNDVNGTAASLMARPMIYRVAVAVMLVGLAAALRIVLLPDLGTRAAFITFYPAIALAALFGGSYTGVLATFLAAGIADYCWMAPVGTFRITDQVDALSMAIFCFGGLLISFVAERAEQVKRRILANNATWLAELEEAVTLRTRELALTSEILQKEIDRRTLYEARFENIVENAPHGIVVLNGCGVIELVNANAERDFGYDRSQLVGRSGDYLVPERYRRTYSDLRDQYFEKPYAGPHMVGPEFYGLRKDGTEFPVEIGFAPIPDRDQMKIVVTITDISARRGAEQALRQSESQKTLIFNSIRDHAILMIGVDGKIMSWNEGAEQLQGYTEDEIIGHDFSKFYIPEAVAAGIPQNNLAQAALHGRFEEEGWRVRKDGSRFQASIVVNSVNSASGELLGFVKVTRDITQRKLIEDELVRSHERVRIAADAARIGFWDYDIASRAVRWDDWMCQIYGTGAMSGPQLAEYWAGAIQADQYANSRAQMAEAVENGGEFMSDMRILTPAGEEKFVRASARIIRDPDGTPREAVGVNVDITETKRAEMRLSEQRDRAEAENRGKSSFLAMMSHEVRTPMNAVIGMNSLLCETALDPRQRKLADGVRLSADLLLRIIDDILDVSKLDAGRLQLENISFDLPRLVEDTVELLAPRAAEKGLRLTSAMSGVQIDNVIGDPTRLRQVILNMVANAIKFTALGSVSVSAYCERHAHDLLRLRVEVSDTGIGIDAEGKSRLFRPFEQMDNTIARRFGGSGLGLYICKNLVTLMGGLIGVEDCPGGGTRFWFELDLPVSFEDDATQLLAVQSLSIAQHETARILLAEDNDLNVQLALLTLEPIGCVIDVASNGRQAVEFAARHAYDLILMDVQMPELDGIGAARIIRETETGRRVPIIAITANVSAEDREVCREAGMDDLLAKPCDPARLRDVVTHWIARGVPVIAAISTDPEASAALPVIDPEVIKSLRDILAGERFVEILDLLVTQISLSIARLDIADPGSKEVATIARSMIDLAIIFGADRVVDLARRLETASTGGEVGMVEAATVTLLSAWDETLIELNLIRAFESGDHRQVLEESGDLRAVPETASLTD